MRRNIELYINRIGRFFGIEIRRKSSIELLENDLEKILLNVEKLEIIDKLQNFKTTNFQALYELIQSSQSQLGQDLFALDANRMKKDGYFVEFGATNGIRLSNTYLLETKFNWSGILVEPARIYFSNLKKNRNSIVINKCVWSISRQELIFREVGDLSTIESFKNFDLHAHSRAKGKNYRVETISLLELLSTNNAPKVIDFLSIDTEGSEFEILRSFDFSQYSFNAICIEHNYTIRREEIYNLLVAKGYRRVFEEISKWDDWYVKQ